jgi:predicted AAA+ superfamily ATPase
VEHRVGARERHLAGTVESLLRDEPAVIVTGPRTAGKSTLARAIAVAHGAPFVDLDDPEERRAVEGNPMLFVRQPGLVVFDEFQYAPELLGAVKASLNAELRPAGSCSPVRRNGRLSLRWLAI